MSISTVPNWAVTTPHGLLQARRKGEVSSVKVMRKREFIMIQKRVSGWGKKDAIAFLYDTRKGKVRRNFPTRSLLSRPLGELSRTVIHPRDRFFNRAIGGKP
ncbi:MAG: hypothetical protein AB4290_16540 [Spirulina sp.]